MKNFSDILAARWGGFNTKMNAKLSFTDAAKIFGKHVPAFIVLNIGKVRVSTHEDGCTFTFIPS